MNEPHTMPTEQWLAAANTALAAIRNAGATNVVFVPGNAWTGAHSWNQNYYGTPNGTVMKGVVDPGNNFVFEVHQYLDGDSSGTSDTCVSTTIGVERLQDFTSWLRTNGYRGFLGEFAGGANTTCDQAVDAMLSFVESNRDVWTGWAWWAAGPWWGDYIFTLEPKDGADRPQMATLAEHLSTSAAATGNPYADALLYVDPDYVTKVSASAAQVTVGSADAQRIEAAKRFPTAVWLDRIAAIDGAKASGGAMGLVDHLNAALAQQQAQSSGGALKPMAVTLVVYDLPDRDCAAYASNGELSSAANGMQRYKTEYIDRIASILARPEYASLRIVTVVEPDSYTNMLTNLSVAACAAVDQKGVYVEGVRYALAKLSALSNVSLYLDIAHSGWLGWDNNRSKAIDGYKALVAGATPGGSLSIIRGFATNTANYTPLDEPFFNGTADVVSTSGTSTFYEWNYAVDELTYIDKLRSEFVAAGFPSSLGFIVDTSRNGWGGSNRPQAAAADVDDMRIDRRAHRGNWCNVKNTGIGERPRANPDATRSYLDAYVFIKPPGDSDGTSDSSATTPNEEGKRFDIMCGATNVDALPNAPHAGRWFHDQFLMLLRNAYPPLN
jgi:cellulose 1,4-beta-cellobiosidase